jgi:hypothetical protein
MISNEIGLENGCKINACQNRSFLSFFLVGFNFRPHKQTCKERLVVFLNEMQKQFSNDEKQRILANRYRIEKKLGSGNFGTAYLVIDQKNYDEE